MKSTATALPRSSSRARPPTLSRLGPSHFGLLMSILLLFGLVFTLLYASVLAPPAAR